MNFFKRKYYQLLLDFLKAINSSDERFVKVQYYYKNERDLNLKNPLEFAEKIQWLKLYHYTEEYRDYADKYAVRDIVEKAIGSSYLNDFISVYDKVVDIDFESLPDQFVLKGTHGSGYNIIVPNKTDLDINSTKKKLNKYLSRNYYNRCREKVYRTIKPRILAEKYLSSLDKGNIIDYKFYCFHGKPKYILVKTKVNDTFKKCMYELSWNKLEPDSSTKNYLTETIEKPSNLDEMISVAKKLSKGFIFIRVDLYSIANKIYFGELTFFPNGGIERLFIERLNKEFGDLIHLPS